MKKAKSRFGDIFGLKNKVKATNETIKTEAPNLFDNIVKNYHLDNLFFYENPAVGKDIRNNSMRENQYDEKKNLEVANERFGGEYNIIVPESIGVSPSYVINDESSKQNVYIKADGCNKVDNFNYMYASYILEKLKMGPRVEFGKNEVGNITVFSEGVQTQGKAFIENEITDEMLSKYKVKPEMRKIKTIAPILNLHDISENKNVAIIEKQNGGCAGQIFDFTIKPDVFFEKDNTKIFFPYTPGKSSLKELTERVTDSNLKNLNDVCQNSFERTIKKVNNLYNTKLDAEDLNLKPNAKERNILEDIQNIEKQFNFTVPEEKGNLKDYYNEKIEDLRDSIKSRTKDSIPSTTSEFVKENLYSLMTNKMLIERNIEKAQVIENQTSR